MTSLQNPLPAHFSWLRSHTTFLQLQLELMCSSIEYLPLFGIATYLTLLKDINDIAISSLSKDLVPPLGQSGTALLGGFVGVSKIRWLHICRVLGLDFVSKSYSPVCDTYAELFLHLNAVYQRSETKSTLDAIKCHQNPGFSS